MGLRGKQTAMAVPSWIRSVATAAKASGMNGSLASSKVSAPSKPRASAAAAAGPAARQLSIGIPVSILNGCSL
jgi:hypothetical protein